MASKAGKLKVGPDEVIAVIRRVLVENGRDFIFHYSIAAVALLAIAGTTAFTAWVMRDVVDEIFWHQRQDMIFLICGAIIVAFVVRGIASYVQAVMLAKVGNNLVAKYQTRMFDHLLRLGVGYFGQTRSGHLAAQINQNVNGVRDLLNLTLTAIARDAVSLVALVGVMFYHDWFLSLMALVIGPPIVYSVNYLMRRLRKITRQAVEVNSRLMGAMQESIQGITIVKAFTMEEQLARNMGKLIRNAEDRNNKIARVSERMTPITEILAGFAIAGVIAYAGWQATVEQGAARLDHRLHHHAAARL